MKNLIICLMIFPAIQGFAQQFSIEKLSGKVQVLKSTEETWIDVKAGQNLSGGDMIQTGEGSSVIIGMDQSRFLLKSNSALGLSYIRKMTINELMLALAAEEIKNIPGKKSKEGIKNTAVYGKDLSGQYKSQLSADEIGLKRLNGARQLAENGFRETAALAAKETYRKYPETRYLLEERLYFADLFMEMRLYDEAYSELQFIKKVSTEEKISHQVDSRLEKLNQIMAEQ